MSPLLAVGLVFGGLLMLTAMCLVVVGKRSDKQSEKEAS